MKLLDQMRQNPQGDWTIADVQAVCRRMGIACDPPRGGGSHYKISHPDIAEIITIPLHRPIKPVYIRKLMSFIDKARVVR